MFILKVLSTALVLPIASIAAPVAPSGTWPPDGTYQNTVLVHHNIHRLNHSAANVTWSRSLQKSAAILAKSCLWGHNTSIDGGGYGQNIAAGVVKSHVSAAITNLFYNHEAPNYVDQYGKPTPNMTLFGEFGHFTQVVWKNTQFVACATANCTAQGLLDASSKQPLNGIPPFFTVCNYSPPGNYLGQFANNVGVPLGEPPVDDQY